MGDGPLVQTVGLKKYFKTGRELLHAVDDINLSIGPGKTLGVVGESGCGKSTLGRTILRLIEPTSGQIYFDGEDITGFRKDRIKKIRSNMQIIFQDPYSSLNPRMSVVEIIAEYMIVNKTWPRKAQAWAQAAKLMDLVGLARRCANMYPHELDGGRRQRIGVARALSLNPRFIVCDEPVSALDVSIQAQILNLLMDLQEEMGLTYLFITHDLSVVRHISDEIMVMYLGQCVERSNPDALFERPLHPYTRALLSAIPEPDIGMRDKAIEVLKGEVTSPISPPPGCRFAPRCGQARERCVASDILTVEADPGHHVACAVFEDAGRAWPQGHPQRE
ncbi:MAG: ABC transporter ATP-binding protein [Deltaproteobacteria bacterium]|jgi:oligopeptide/dipeptide ABC transporter ATP-binding protein|nr:ABC transporter ATP-binding protein [Deltaproteobacteria bacterium]